MATTFETRKTAYLNQATAEADTLTEGNAVKAYTPVLDTNTTVLSFSDGLIADRGPLCLCDPLTQLASRLNAFFNHDPDVIIVSNIDNSHAIGPEEEHYTALNVYVKTSIMNNNFDVDKAVAIGNLLYRDLVVPEEYEGSDGIVHTRIHHLIIKVFACGALTPTIANQHGLLATGDESIFWEVPELTPEALDALTKEEKWEMVKLALTGNTNIYNLVKVENKFARMPWYFIEASRVPITWSEDNLTNLYGYNTALPIDLLRMFFRFMDEFQVSTYARENNTKHAV